MPARRRWFQFSLATMFVVVAVFALLLGWQLHLVRQRAAMLNELRDTGVHVSLLSDWSATEQAQHAKLHGNLLPFWRTWLGDQVVLVLVFPGEAPPETIKAALEYFPEAKVIDSRTRGSTPIMPAPAPIPAIGK